MGLKEAWDFVTGAKARQNRYEAECIHDDAEQRYEKGLAAATQMHKTTERTLQELGKQRLEIAAKTLPAVVDYLAGFVAVDTVDIRAAMPPDVEFSVSDLEMIRAEGDKTLQILAGGATTAALGAVGAWGAVSTFGVASTGTAIASLSGAAATKATLAALGGGALSAGGYGIAGGMVALGGIAFVPLVAAGILARVSSYKRSEEALTQAMAFAAEVDVKLEELNALQTGLKAITARCIELSTITDELAKRLLQAQDGCRDSDAKLRDSQDRLPTLVEERSSAEERLQEVRVSLALCVDQLTAAKNVVVAETGPKETAERKAAALQSWKESLQKRAVTGFILFRWWHRLLLRRVLTLCSQADGRAEATRQSWEQAMQHVSALELENAALQRSLQENTALLQDAVERVELLQRSIEALVDERTKHRVSMIALTLTVHQLIKIPVLDDSGRATARTDLENHCLERSA